MQAASDVDEKLRQTNKEMNDTFLEMMAQKPGNIVIYDTDRFHPRVLINPSPEDLKRFVATEVYGQKWFDANYDRLKADHGKWYNPQIWKDWVKENKQQLVQQHGQEWVDQNLMDGIRRKVMRF